MSVPNASTWSGPRKRDRVFGYHVDKELAILQLAEPGRIVTIARRGRSHPVLGRCDSTHLKATEASDGAAARIEVPDQVRRQDARSGGEIHRGRRHEALELLSAKVTHGSDRQEAGPASRARAGPRRLLSTASHRARLSRGLAAVTSQTPSSWAFPSRRLSSSGRSITAMISTCSVMGNRSNALRERSAQPESSTTVQVTGTRPDHMRHDDPARPGLKSDQGGHHGPPGALPGGVEHDEIHATEPLAHQARCDCRLEHGDVRLISRVPRRVRARPPVSLHCEHRPACAHDITNKRRETDRLRQTSRRRDFRAVRPAHPARLGRGRLRHQGAPAKRPRRSPRSGVARL